MSQPQRTLQFVFENTTPDNYSANRSRSASVVSNNVAPAQIPGASSRELPLEPSPLDSQDDYSTGPTEFYEEVSAAESCRVIWTEKINWIFLQIMFGIQDFLSKATDSLVKKRVWDRALEVFREQLRSNYSNSLDQVRVFFSRSFRVEKMQDQWDRKKSKYRELKNQNEMTGIGGTHPNISWPFYDEVEKILANDRNIHPRAVVATSINGEGPSLTVLERDIPGDLSDIEREEMAKEKARRNGIIHLSLNRIKEKILDPACRYGRLRQARGVDHSSSSRENVTGDGRQTRNGDQDENANVLSSIAQTYRALFEEALSKSDERAGERMQEFHRLAFERDRLRFERIEQILQEQRRLDKEEREEFFNRRSTR